MRKMQYGKNARVGNLKVFNRQGAINAYKIFCAAFNKSMTHEASCVLSDAGLDMVSLGFTPYEIEKIEMEVC